MRINLSALCAASLVLWCGACSEDRPTANYILDANSIQARNGLQFRIGEATCSGLEDIPHLEVTCDDAGILIGYTTDSRSEGMDSFALSSGTRFGDGQTALLDDTPAAVSMGSDFSGDPADEPFGVWEYSVHGLCVRGNEMDGVFLAYTGTCGYP